MVARLRALYPSQRVSTRSNHRSIETPGSGPGPEVTGSSGCSGLPGRGRVPVRGRPGAAAQTRPGWSRETHYRSPAIMLTPFREPARPGRTRAPGTMLDAESEDSQEEQTRTAQETALDAA